MGTSTEDITDQIAAEISPGEGLPKAITSTNVHSFLDSQHPLDRTVRLAVFSDQFQTRESWNHFMDQHLGHDKTVLDTLTKPGKEWTAETFQALYMANWLAHPVEKGSYMIDLAGLDAAQVGGIQDAHKRLKFLNFIGRPSSHLGGDGSSAGRGYDFLKGYKELLVQVDTINDKPYLFLKTEGHPFYSPDHIKSWANKRKTGEGLTQSPALHAFAEASPLMRERAAENYSKVYQALLDSLNLKGKKVPVREVTERLFQTTGYQHAQLDINATTTNQELGTMLADYCNGAERRQLGSGKTVTDAMIADLRGVAESLKEDGPTQHSRVYREIIVTPEALQVARERFRTLPASPPLPSQTPQLPVLPVLSTADQWKRDTALGLHHPRDSLLRRVDASLDSYDKSSGRYLLSLLAYERNPSTATFATAKREYDNALKNFKEAQTEFQAVDSSFAKWDESYPNTKRDKVQVKGKAKSDDDDLELARGPVTRLRDQLASGRTNFEVAQEQMNRVERHITDTRTPSPTQLPEPHAAEPQQRQGGVSRPHTPESSQHPQQRSGHTPAAQPSRSSAEQTVRRGGGMKH